MAEGDRLDKKCDCGGTYQETTIYDDWDGTLHCTWCDKKVKRYESEDVE